MTNLNVNITLVETIDEVMALKRWMSESHDYLAIDTETVGLEWWHEKPRLFQIGNAEQAWALDWDGWGIAIAEILNNYQGDLLFFNAKFDCTMIEHWSNGRVQIPRHRVKDVAIMANVLDPSQPGGLKALSEKHVDRAAARSQRILEEAMQTNGWTWETVPINFQPYWMYGGLDTILTSRLYEKLWSPVMSEAPRSYELEMGTIWALMDLERKGVEVDVEYTKKTKQDFLDYVEKCNDWVQEAYGFSARKPYYKEKLIQQVQKDTNYEFTEKTPSGKIKFDKEVMDDVIYYTQHPLIVTEKTRRKMDNMVSKYLNTFLEKQHNGRLHASFNQLNKQDSNSTKMGTVTGRMTVKNPALQTLPKRSDEDTTEARAANAIRNCLTATGGGEDHSLILCDLDQIEQRLQASYSQDQKLLNAFKESEASGIPYFVLLGREIYQDPSMTKGDRRYSTTKNTIYAEGYGAGMKKLALTAGVSIQEIEQFMANYGNAYPQRKRWANELIKLAEQRYDTEGQAYIRSPITGRRLPALYRDKAYTLVNYFVQGTAAEILKIKTLEMRRAGVDDLVLLVHDEVIADVPKEEQEEKARIIHSIMNDDEILEGVRMTAGYDIVPRWGAQNDK